MYPQPRPILWWTQRPGYIRYMLRESTAVLILIYLIDVLWRGNFNAAPDRWALWIGLIGAIGHTFSWLWLCVLLVAPKTETWKIVVYFASAFAFAGLSFLLYRYLYV